ncbi:hypothetical protein AUJ46_05415 [Candidatus Peregrinibacteria bacterium CG1_02_54_53]|nr:MAG: hypothetical protein AUJ46_05415 [Candidatus Peregrinibacteria bacterium CG1_02_54_53]
MHCAIISLLLDPVCEEDFNQTLSFQLMENDSIHKTDALPEKEAPKRKRKRSAPKLRVSLSDVRAAVKQRMTEAGLGDEESIRRFLEIEANANCGLHIGELELGIRTSNALEENAQITRVLELLFWKRHELLAVSGIGDLAIDNIYEALENVGLTRKKSAPEATTP